MAHPIVGLWQVDIDYHGQHTHVTHAFHPDGIMRLDAADHGASLLWEPTGQRSFRIQGTRPIEPEIFVFVGWQYAHGEGEVSEDGTSYTMGETTDAPQPDGTRVKRYAAVQGTRVTFDST
jgi:hypothetical protein